ncbi:maleylpyruvate isomerase family mycothiol-dependent enzyme [Nonomuraea sp. B19D2]|uniref:maleylpyruvate isomerase family mycothiol-dependent enzyme n=1 Tax=Nonomuraea sp. B19D2 TaxID=3159561 RepID=UPI0032DA5908
MNSRRHDLSATLPWMRQGSDRLLTLVEKLTDDDFQEPSLLPGWTRAHVIAHVARNAEALTRLARWAATGIETPMYADRQQRAAEIEQTAKHPAHRLRSDLASTALTLHEALAALTGQQWAATVRSALGRAIPAAEVPWMRAREVWLHAVDLDSDADMEDVPADLIDLLADDVTATLSGKNDCPAVTLVPTDRDLTWRLGTGEHNHDGAVVHASAAALVGWLTGRVPPERLPGSPPALPAWL